MADDMTSVTTVATTGDRVHTHVLVWCAMAGDSTVRLTSSVNSETVELIPD